MIRSILHDLRVLYQLVLTRLRFPEIQRAQ